MGHKLICRQPVEARVPAVETMQTKENMKILIITVQNMYARNDYASIVDMCTQILFAADMWMATRIPVPGILLYTKLAQSLAMSGAHTQTIELLQLSTDLCENANMAEMDKYIFDNAPKKNGNALPHIAGRNDMQVHLFEMKLNLGHAFIEIGQFCKAEHALKATVRQSEESGDPDLITNSRMAMGKCLFFQEDYASAAVFREKTLSILLECKRLSRTANATEKTTKISKSSASPQKKKKHRQPPYLVSDLKIVAMMLRVAQCSSIQGHLDQAIDCRVKTWALLCNRPDELDADEYNNYKMMTSLSLGIDLAVCMGMCSTRSGVGAVQAEIFLKCSVSSTDANTENTHPYRNQSIDEVKHWFETALGLANKNNCLDVKNDILLHVAFMFFDMDLEDLGMMHLRQHLDSQLRIKHAWCRACSRLPTANNPILICCGCHVVGFCNKDHQMTSSGQKKSKLLRSDIISVNVVRHKDICSLLNQWRRVAQGKISAESCTQQHKEFLMGPAWWKSRRSSETYDGSVVHGAVGAQI